MMTRCDPDGYKATLDERVNTDFLVRAARVLVTKTTAEEMVVELMNSGAFSLSEAWRAVDAIKEPPQVATVKQEHKE